VCYQLALGSGPVLEGESSEEMLRAVVQGQGGQLLARVFEEVTGLVSIIIIIIITTTTTAGIILVAIVIIILAVTIPPASWDGGGLEALR
jgi:hypothetical protein